MTARNWLITGVSSGFGRELATQLLDRGEIVVGTVRRPDSVADLVQRETPKPRSCPPARSSASASSPGAPSARASSPAK
jgi:NAD(P)-dependent dehydrogenase (short-subunit alcohol dehydrogenase family)